MLSTCRHPWWLHAIPNDGYNEGHMDAVWWFNVECFHDFTAAYNGVAGSCADAHRKSDSCVMNRHLITDETKPGSVWYVRKCPWMNRAASVPNGMRNDEARQRASRIEKPCREWILYWMRGVWEMTHVRAGVRYVGMGWCWQHARDEICDATMIAVPNGGTYRTGTCRRHARDSIVSLPSSGWFQKMRRCHYCTVFCCFFFFFTRVTQLAKNHSWSAKRNAGNGDLHMVRSCCGNLYENENILSYLYVHIGSNGVIETWVGFCRLDYRRSVNINIMKFDH